MIVEWFVAVAFGIFSLVASGMGTSPAPGWLTSLAGDLNGLVETTASLGTWVPWSFFGPALGSIAACLGISLVVRLVRIGVSLVTGGGGSAA